MQDRVKNDSYTIAEETAAKERAANSCTPAPLRRESSNYCILLLLYPHCKPFMMTSTRTIKLSPPPPTTATKNPTVQTTPPLSYDPFRKGGTSANNSGKKKAGTKDADSKGIWVSMLDEVSRGKDLAEKQLIILGAHGWTPFNLKSPFPFRPS